jgi:hypothetical protein
MRKKIQSIKCNHQLRSGTPRGGIHRTSIGNPVKSPPYKQPAGAVSAKESFIVLKNKLLFFQIRGYHRLIQLEYKSP